MGPFLLFINVRNCTNRCVTKAVRHRNSVLLLPPLPPLLRCKKDTNSEMYRSMNCSSSVIRTRSKLCLATSLCDSINTLIAKQVRGLDDTRVDNDYTA